MVRVLILVGYGINCDYETEHAFKMNGAETEKVHVNELISRKKNLEDYHILAIPGGFSYADDIAAGKVLANKMRTNISDQVEKFVEDEKLIIGVCNGFQVMMKYSMLPEFNSSQNATLSWNDSGRFEDRWVYLKVNEKSPCIWTKGIKSLYLPVRHAEGKFIPRGDGILTDLHEKNRVVAQYVDENGNLNPRYPLNPNGSVDDIAGICDDTGRIFGIMPHPEAYLYKTNHPRWTRENVPEEGMGVQVFRNAVEYVKEKLI